MVDLLKLRKTEMDSQIPTEPMFFKDYYDVILSLSNAMNTVEQKRFLILFGRVQIQLPPVVTPSRIHGVNF